MPDDREQLRQALNARRDELEREQRQMQAEVTVIQSKLAQVRVKLDSIEALLHVEFGAGDLAYAEMGITAAAADVLQKHGGQMHVKDIMKRMQDGGYRTNAQRPGAMLSGTLRKSNRFKCVGGDVFELTE